MKSTAISAILFFSALTAWGDQKAPEAVEKQAEELPETWFPNVDGFATKGEFIDLSAPEKGRLYIRYGAYYDSGVEVEKVDGAGKVVWRYQMERLGVAHKKYRHEVRARIDGKNIRVTSVGVKRINEVIDLATGKKVSRTIIESEP